MLLTVRLTMSRDLTYNDFAYLPAGTFDGLSSLTRLWVKRVHAFVRAEPSDMICACTNLHILITKYSQPRCSIRHWWDIVISFFFCCWYLYAGKSMAYVVFSRMHLARPAIRPKPHCALPLLQVLSAMSVKFRHASFKETLKSEEYGEGSGTRTVGFVLHYGRYCSGAGHTSIHSQLASATCVINFTTLAVSCIYGVCFGTICKNFPTYQGSSLVVCAQAQQGFDANTIVSSGLYHGWNRSLYSCQLAELKAGVFNGAQNLEVLWVIIYYCSREIDVLVVDRITTTRGCKWGLLVDCQHTETSLSLHPDEAGTSDWPGVLSLATPTTCRQTPLVQIMGLFYVYAVKVSSTDVLRPQLVEGMGVPFM